MKNRHRQNIQRIICFFICAPFSLSSICKYKISVVEDKSSLHLFAGPYYRMFCFNDVYPQQLLKNVLANLYSKIYWKTSIINNQEISKKFYVCKVLLQRTVHHKRIVLQFLKVIAVWSYDIIICNLIRYNMHWPYRYHTFNQNYLVMD